MNSVISVKDLCLWYNKTAQALKNVSIDIEENAITAAESRHSSKRSTA